MLKRWNAVLSAVVFCGLWTVARADGPHWQVPNPDGEDYTLENTPDGKPPAAPPKGGGGKGGNNEDYRRNPGNFMLMDKDCIDYYERHSVIKHDGNNLAFYLKIINRCAQAMREVDHYLPCPDSFPLWHTEELRLLMLEYAKKTWIRSTQLDRKTAEECAKLAVQCYIDTVRLSTGVKENTLAAKVKQFWDGNQELTRILQKMDEEKDPGKKKALMDEWRQKGKNGLNKLGLDKDVAAFVTTFKMMTGDIPMLVEDAETRMAGALYEMGTIVIPYLQKFSADKSPRVQNAAQELIKSIQKEMVTPRLRKPTMSNVIDQIRWIKDKPGSPEATAAIKVLKDMGPEGWDELVNVAENKNLDHKQAAYSALASATGKGFGQNAERWRAYIQEERDKAKPKDAAKPVVEEPKKAEEPKKTEKPPDLKDE